MHRVKKNIRYLFANINCPKIIKFELLYTKLGFYRILVIKIVFTMLRIPDVAIKILKRLKDI